MTHPSYGATDPGQKWEPTNLAELRADLDRLEARLRDGEQRIAEAEALAVDTTDWEAFWRDLYDQYVALYRRLGPQDGGA